METYELFCIVTGILLTSSVQHSLAHNPCCSFPCVNGGVCMTEGFTAYSCDCTSTGFYGARCEMPASWRQSLRYWLRPEPDTIHHFLSNYKWFWDIVNRIPFIRRFLMKIIYIIRASSVDSPNLFTSEHEYVTFGAATNTTHYARALPPIHRNCPTPMGVAGKKELPDVGVIVEEFFRRRTFQTEVHGSNLLFTFFAQHFTHMFFKTDLKKGPQYTWGGHGVDVSHIYGPDQAAEHQLRTFTDGKLKTQVLNGEVWPPNIQDAPVKMTYPPNLPAHKQFAIGHEFFGLLPGLFVYSAIWLREHNRVCDVLEEQHPEWDDEQIFQTAKLILVGETINMVIVDYVQHLSRYNFKLTFEPELLFGEPFQYQNRIALEFNHLYHWHPLMPDDFVIGNQTYQPREFFFNLDIAVEHGMEKMVGAFLNQSAGKVTSQNHSNFTLHIAAETIQHGRDLRLQSLNNYRRRFRLPAYRTFEELTGETQVAGKLEELYGDIEAVEFYVGVMVEKHRPNGMFGSTIIEVGGPMSVKGLMSNPICSPKFWRPSTFGGEVGFNIVKTATLKTLFCQNMRSCPDVSFVVPDELRERHVVTCQGQRMDHCVVPEL